MISSYCFICKHNLSIFMSKSYLKLSKKSYNTLISLQHIVVNVNIIKKFLFLSHITQLNYVHIKQNDLIIFKVILARSPFYHFYQLKMIKYSNPRNVRAIFIGGTVLPSRKRIWNRPYR